MENGHREHHNKRSKKKKIVENWFTINEECEYGVKQ